MLLFSVKMWHSRSKKLIKALFFWWIWSEYIFLRLHNISLPTFFSHIHPKIATVNNWNERRKMPFQSMAQSVVVFLLLRRNACCASCQSCAFISSLTRLGRRRRCRFFSTKKMVRIKKAWNRKTIFFTGVVCFLPQELWRIDFARCFLLELSQEIMTWGLKTYGTQGPRLATGWAAHDFLVNQPFETANYIRAFLKRKTLKKLCLSKNSQDWKRETAPVHNFMRPKNVIVWFCRIIFHFLALRSAAK